MEKIEKIINDNLLKFNNFSNSEVSECSLDEFDNEIIEFLKENYRFDYNGICIYYVVEDDNIWIENMES